MISFRVDSRSVAPPYLQIVQQVKQALRMGLLDVGDRLPAVREVVAATAVNRSEEHTSELQSQLEIVRASCRERV